MSLAAWLLLNHARHGTWRAGSRLQKFPRTRGGKVFARFDTHIFWLLILLCLFNSQLYSLCFQSPTGSGSEKAHGHASEGVSAALANIEFTAPEPSWTPIYLGRNTNRLYQSDQRETHDDIKSMHLGEIAWNFHDRLSEPAELLQISNGQGDSIFNIRPIFSRLQCFTSCGEGRSKRSNASGRRSSEAALPSYFQYPPFQLREIVVQTVKSRSRSDTTTETRQRWKHGQEVKCISQVSWFNEWPNGLRPLSTTWPWNIRPSLVVLWGVCWMFNDNVEAPNCLPETNQAPAPSPQINIDEFNSQGAHPQTGLSDNDWLEYYNPPKATWSSKPELHQDPDSSSEQPTCSSTEARIKKHPDRVQTSWSPAERESRRGLIQPGSDSAQPLPRHVTDDVGLSAKSLNRVSRLSLAGRELQSQLLPGADNIYSSHLLADRHAALDPGVTRGSSSVAHQGPEAARHHCSKFLSPSSYPVRSQYPDAAALATGCGSANDLPCPGISGDLTTSALSDAWRPLDRVSNDRVSTQEPPKSVPPRQYIIPGSAAPFVERGNAISSPFSSQLQQNDVLLNIPGMNDGAGYPSPRSEGPATSPVMASNEVSQMPQRTTSTPRPKLAVKRTRAPPTNSNGELYCDHADCRDKVPIFRRPCEWNKHMDKHDRPYKCTDPGCSKMPGFTYSGGLLRHQREVHKINMTGKKLMCPYPGCNRNSGKGFTRTENLKEHLRRLHRTGDKQSPEAQPPADAAELEPEDLPSPAKRKRDDNSPEPGSDAVSLNVKLREEVNRLRRENQEKDARLVELENIVRQLREIVKDLPERHEKAK